MQLSKIAQTKVLLPPGNMDAAKQLVSEFHQLRQINPWREYRGEQDKYFRYQKMVEESFFARLEELL